MFQPVVVLIYWLLWMLALSHLRWVGLPLSWPPGSFDMTPLNFGSFLLSGIARCSRLYILRQMWNQPSLQGAMLTFGGGHSLGCGTELLLSASSPRVKVCSHCLWPVDRQSLWDSALLCSSCISESCDLLPGSDTCVDHREFSWPLVRGAVDCQAVLTGTNFPS